MLFIIILVIVTILLFLKSWECIASYNLTAFVVGDQHVRGLEVKFFPDDEESLLGVLFADGHQRSKVRC